MTDHKTSIHGSAENAARMRATLGIPEPEAHTPTNDEREAAEKAILNALYDSGEAFSGTGDEVGTDETAILVDHVPDIVLALGFRRSEIPEPGARLDLAFREELVEYSKHRIAEAWGDPVNGADAETLARQIVGAQEFMWIARGFPVESTEVPKAQGEPSDAVANAVARAIIEHDEDRLTCYDHPEDFCCPCGTHGMSRSEWQRHRARAALRAAGGVR